MSVIRVGSTSTYAAGWDAIFGSGKVAKSGKGNAKKARNVAGKAVKRKVAAKPSAVKAARQARKKQSARSKR